jgi:hypothetical protein
MTHDPPSDESADDGPDEFEQSALAAYDLNGDGEISPIEEARAVLGLADARLEQVAEEGGVKGKIADAAHHLVDKFDND